MKYCPMMNSSKEVMFLGELEEVLEATQDVEFKLVWSIYSDNLLYASTVNIFRFRHHNSVFLSLSLVTYKEVVSLCLLGC